MNKNDKKVMQLKDKLEKRKFELKNKPVFNPKTNCIFTMFGQKYNLHVMNGFELSMIFSWLKNLNNENMLLEGFEVKDWMTDIMNIMVKNDYINQENEIKKLEKRLDNLISDDAKTEIEIEKLSKIIGF